MSHETEGTQLRCAVARGGTTETRREAADELRSEHRDRVPVLLRSDPLARLPPLLEHQKLLVRSRMTAGGFLTSLRKQLQPKPTGRLYLVLGRGAALHRAQLNAHLGQLYDDHKDDDGFLYACLTNQKEPASKEKLD
jgi:GABA(A) receptor-associated protein